MADFIATRIAQRAATGVWTGQMAGIVKLMQGVMRAAGIAAAAAGALFAAVEASELIDVRYGPNKDATRIVFDLAGEPAYQVSGDDAGEGRLIVTFAALKLRPADAAPQAGKGHVASLAFEDAKKDGVRAVLTFNKTAKIKEVFVLQPKDGVAHHRLVVDLLTADKPAFLASLPARYGDLTSVIEQAMAEPGTVEQLIVTDAGPKAVEAAPVPEAPTVKDQVAADTALRTVVIDPGHGGRDPGAQGQSGTLEKAVTLAAAEELAALLKARGRYKVVLTRESDTTIRPDQREALARGAGADLFISLHADAIEESSVRGASVYTLSARSVSLAKSQGNVQAYGLQINQCDAVVGDILLDKAQDKTLTNSSKFAELLIGSLADKTPLLNRSHRKGDLRVLLATDVPAVLLEMAFISNAKDEANLISPVWRKRAMTAVADSIDAYFASEAPERHAQLAPGPAK